ncbi:MAG: DUF4193 family protein [Acidimicrobiia bacterium]|nr:DUF4193 family protein [Acidimicrobiia bacterium]MYF82953.1 DUF4193 family protein [Acidimicrobiia bacterium]
MRILSPRSDSGIRGLDDAIRDPFEGEGGDDLANENRGHHAGHEDNDDENGNGAVELDALEAEELETVEATESATMLVDETSEIREIRRSEMNLDIEAEQMRGDEFVCRSCFLRLKKVQLAADALCRDCA